MRLMLEYAALTVVLALGAGIAANAEQEHHNDLRLHEEPSRHKVEPPRNNLDRQAPEIDPSLAIGGFSLLAGTLTVLRTRSRK